MGKGRGGGDGGAAQMEAERQARVRAATDEINKIFNSGSRQKLYDQQRQAVLAFNRDNLARQFADATRLNRFGLARAGQLGGSLDVDTNAQLERTNNEGLIKAAQLADQSAAQLQAQDESSRSQLISTAQAGIDTGTIAQQASAQLLSNLNNAAATQRAQSIGDIFGGLNQAWKERQYNNAYKAQEGA